MQNIAPEYNAIYERNLATTFKGKIYASSYDQESPSISGTNVVWEQTLSSGQPLIYMKNLLTGHVGKLVATKDLQMFPNISGSRVVWTQITTSGVVTLNYKNLATGFTSKLASSTSTIFTAAIDGTRVVWMAIGHDEPYTPSLYYKNLESGKNSKIGTPNMSISPDISGTNIIWNEVDSSDHYSIYMKDLVTGVTKKLNL